MEKDIKILKDMIDNLKQRYLPSDVYILEEDLAAIENILARLDQLEKENNELKRMFSRRIQYTQELEKDLFENCSNYVVPKAKINEKIEKLEKEFHFFAGREHAEWQDGEFDGDVCDDLALQIRVLKELLR